VNPLPPSADRVRLEGLRIVARHGLLPEERSRPQPFSIDLDLEGDLAPPGATDELELTIDYGEVVEAVSRVVGETSVGLLERLVTLVADEVLRRFPLVDRVGVTLTKLRPPVPADLGAASVRCWRERPRRAAYLGLGSNLGDRLGHLRVAVASLPDVVAVSRVYETAPVGGPPGQGPYLNLVVALATARSPRGLLAVARRLEQAAGRVRTVTNGPRTLDVDVLFVGEEQVDEPDLVVPHPRLFARRFVLAPLSELAPDRVPPDSELRAEGEVRVLGPLVQPGAAG